MLQAILFSLGQNLLFALEMDQGEEKIIWPIFSNELQSSCLSLGFLSIHLWAGGLLFWGCPRWALWPLLQLRLSWRQAPAALQASAEWVNLVELIMMCPHPTAARSKISRLPARPSHGPFQPRLPLALETSAHIRSTCTWKCVGLGLQGRNQALTGFHNGSLMLLEPCLP